MAQAMKRKQPHSEDEDVEHKRLQLNRFLDEVARGEHPGVAVLDVEKVKDAINKSLDATLVSSKSEDSIFVLSEQNKTAARDNFARVLSVAQLETPSPEEDMEGAMENDDSKHGKNAEINEESSESSSGEAGRENSTLLEDSEGPESDESSMSTGDLVELDTDEQVLAIDDEQSSGETSKVSCESDDDGRSVRGTNDGDAASEASNAAVAPADIDMESDDDLDVSDTERAEFIERFSLSIPPQRLGVHVAPSRAERAGREVLEERDNIPNEEECSEVVYGNTQYAVGKGYRCRVDRKDVIVGIVRIVHRKERTITPECVLLLSYTDTVLGSEDFRPCNYVRVEGPPFEMSFDCFQGECADVIGIPKLIYRPFLQGSFHFAYYYEDRQPCCGPRSEPTVMELFAGAGGMHQGFKDCGFKTAMVVEKDAFAVQTFSANNAHAPVFPGDVSLFLDRCENATYRAQLGTIDHIHAGPPCQGFSTANRTGGRNDEANNKLSHTFVRAIRIFRPVTATFENVTGMLRKKHLHHLITILRQLLEMGYQFRCAIMKASDYGDPQKRPRLIIFAAQKATPLPKLPLPTHGSGADRSPFFTVQDAIGFLPDKDDGSYANMAFASTRATRDDDDTVVLDPNGLAGAIRCSSRQPFHYRNNRCIRVREAALLQSFPLDYVFWGDTKEQYRQIGNAVPFNLAAAIARSVGASLKYR